MKDDWRIGDRRHEQEVADRALRDLFSGRPCPDLPPSFPSRCATLGGFQPSARPLGARGRRLMRTYWAATLIIASVVVARIEWPTTTSPIVATGALLAIAATAVPVVFFAHLRGGPFALTRRLMG